MVQNFTVFEDRIATVKIKTTKISMGGENDDVTVNKLKLLCMRMNDRSSNRFNHVRP